MNKLPDAPTTPWTDEGATPGTYRGECDALPFDAHFSRIDRVRAQKRWLWCGVMSAEIAVGLAIVRTGYAANVFCWVFDRQRREFLQDTSRVLPRPTVVVADTPPRHGIVAQYRGLVEGIKVTREGARWRVEGTVGDAFLDLTIDEMAEPATAICPARGGDNANPRLNVTQKQALASATGIVRIGTQRLSVDSATALLDHSHGMLSGETIWQWAIGGGEFENGEPVGFNFVASFNDGLENTIWMDGEPTLSGELEFEIPEDRMQPWRVTGERVDLSMVPEGLRSQELDLAIIASDYLQPLGTWHGTIDGRTIRAYGVAELHRSVW